MGGKKKTKWRKLPLAEFTKECPPTVSKNESKQDFSKDEETLPPIPSYEELAVNINQYNEYGEYTDGSNMLYPTVVYNPMEMPFYMLPPDACYYYLPAVQEYAPVNYIPPVKQEYAPVSYIPPVKQEYAPVSYIPPVKQEYVPAPYIPPVKDTVYLLLPAPAVRSSHVAYDWRNRRGRRRYKGYAEYAVIPEKNNYSTNREEEDRSRRLEWYDSRNDHQSSHTRTMNSFSETNPSSREGNKRVQEFNEKKFIGSKEQGQISKNVDTPQVDRNENVQEIQNLKPRKNQEFCGVHTPRASDRKNFQNNSAVSFQEKQSEFKDSQQASQDVVPSTEKSKDFQKQVQEIEQNEEVTDKLKCQDTVYQLQILKGMEKTQEENTNNKTGMDLNISKPPGYSLNNSSKDTGERISVQNSDFEVITASDTFVNHQNRSETENPNEVNSSSPLPDILSALHKTVPSMPKTTSNDTSRINDKQSESLLFDKTPPPREKFSKSKIILSQSPYISHSLNSDSSSHDTEADLKCLTNLQSLRTNQSIYKLAYDESITDQSEADSRSPSPVDPETQVPKSIVNDEILIHEADSCSDAGSEDVELIPHRYESETFLHDSKHVYVNKLSLAVELLRTQESLPYDDQFKRVSGASNLEENIGEVNFGFIDFVDDSSSFDGLKTDNSHDVITSQSPTRPRNSTAVSSFSFEEACSESCEEAKEVIVEAAHTRDNSDGVRAGYRRFQVQFRHYFTPRTALVNPCLCCVIM